MAYQQSMILLMLFPENFGGYMVMLLEGAEETGIGSVMTQHGDLLAGKIAFQEQSQRLVEPLFFPVSLKRAARFRPEGLGKMFPRNAELFCQCRGRQRLVKRILDLVLEITNLPTFPRQVELSFCRKTKALEQFEHHLCRFQRGL